MGWQCSVQPLAAEAASLIRKNHIFVINEFHMNAASGRARPE
jgi:hypothetical protein